MDAEALLKTCLQLDLEAGEGRIFSIGAVFDGKVFSRKGRFDAAIALRELDAFAGGARGLLGHNLLGHDLPVLRGLAPGLGLHGLPVIDTLYLSPIAFPENPYHRLVKDYKLVHETVNDPVADAKLAASLFADQWESFEGMARDGRMDMLAFYRFCFRGNRSDAPHRGLAGVFAALGAPAVSRDEAFAMLRKRIDDRVCGAALERFAPGGEEPFTRSPEWAYALAWLRVAGANSVLPPWVRRQFPDVGLILGALRDVPCASPDCAYCRTAHDAKTQLQRYFGFPGFRPYPKTESGESLQEAIVRSGMADRPLLAILPTGGGKSLCYQLPALARHFRRGALTIVITPLQALIKDQADNLAAKTGTPYCSALYAMLPPIERWAALERTRMGDAAILYVSPEQLRNKSFRSAIAEREIGCWVFDEAHCISKWGHDFRTDYLYAGRFIREFAEEQRLPIPPVACFTATAKKDVIEEIQDFFLRELRQELTLFEGSVERANLHFEVRTVATTQKLAAIHEILAERLSGDDEGSAIVYAATQKKAREIAEYLRTQGWPAALFHGGLEGPDKRAVQESFLSGQLRVIAATNAFGMGIDKENVRLVLHANIPGSLENYIQEAGRAGRDLKDAECVLLFDEQDVEIQFQLGAMSKLGRRDIAEILRVLRRARRSPSGDVIITPTEILREDEADVSFDADDLQADTKVKTAVAWLERAGFLERNENHTRAFQGRLLVSSMEEARKKMEPLRLSSETRQRWEFFLKTMMNSSADEGMDADALAELGGLWEAERNAREAVENDICGERGETPSQRVLRTLHSMAEAGLIEKGVMLTAFVRNKVHNPPVQALDHICELEESMLQALREVAPDAAEEDWQDLSLRRLNQRLKNIGLKSSPEMITRLLKSLSLDGRGFAGSKGSIQYRHVFQDHYRVKHLRDWDAMVATSRKRRATARVILDAILEKIPPDAPASAAYMVGFSLDDLVKAIRSHLFLAQEVKDPLAAVDRGLLFLHEHDVIRLHKGLSVFRPAMSVRISPEARKGRYLKGDYEPLEQHYKERIFQVHVVNEYARLGVEQIRKALELVLAYFTMDRLSFIRRFFPGRKEMLERATAQESFQRIVDKLANPVQMAIVASPEDSNMLVLAGPGAGKTRVVVHRCAYLLRVLRAPARSILALCFNHYAAVELRRRLFELVGSDAKGVTIQTYHSLAMRLAGLSFAELAERGKGEDYPFDDVIPEAIRLLRGEAEFSPAEPDEARERLLAGFRHILVDEYQDIDDKQYELVSAIAGRTAMDPDAKLAIMAVGDDDQNIYTFRGANVELIRKFSKDYGASTHHLTDNYRSTAYIIAAANALIAHNKDRMKKDHPIRIDRAREREHPGGAFGELDPLSGGKVQVITVEDARDQAAAFVAEAKRIREIAPGTPWSGIAVLAREHGTLAPIRAACERCGIPAAWTIHRGGAPPALHRIREIAEGMDRIRARGKDILSASRIEKMLEEAGVLSPPGDANPWCNLLREILASWREETADAPLPASQALEAVYDALAERRREQRVGDGVFFGTVHGAKGMEFPHVFLCDGGWRTERDAAGMEEERRAFYVGMTRARNSLCIFRRSDVRNPHLPLLDGDYRLDRNNSAASDVRRALAPELLRVRYEMLGLKDILIGYAGRCAENAPIHRQLAALQPGSRLSMRVMKNGGVELADSEGSVVARLSQAAAERWRKRLHLVREVRVIGMIRREKKDESEEYRNSRRSERWEIPWLEVVWEELEARDAIAPPVPRHEAIAAAALAERAVQRHGG